MAGERGAEARVVELTSARESAPSAHGVFQILYAGRLLSYYYLTRKDLGQALGPVPATTP